MPWRGWTLFVGMVCLTSPVFASIENSIQTGLEFDSNPLKSFESFQGDALIRFFLKSSGKFFPHPSLSLGWDYQGGGKKYLEFSDQDTIIQSLELPVQWKLNPHVQISLFPQIKYQNERDSVDVLHLDVNEDFYSPSALLVFNFLLPYQMGIHSHGGFQYFSFDPIPSFSFFREWGSFRTYKTFQNLFEVGALYEFSQQQFQESLREDSRHEVGVFFRFLKTPLLLTQYVFQKTNSSEPSLSNHNHRLTFSLSVPFGSQTKTSSLFAFHLLTTLQFKTFPSITDYTEEGIRFLLTDSEDENFNSLVAKISCHPTEALAVEAKFTRFSNEFSSQQSNFQRFMMYTGIRWNF